jgi:hypothetical protein
MLGLVEPALQPEPTWCLPTRRAYSAKRARNRIQGMRYTVTLERTSNILSAYVPDLSDCVSTGATKEELQANIAEVILLHLDGMI